jgi:UDP-3-O-[3-hydroxymyristoyl] glucosamine N-acyltransferase
MNEIARSDETAIDGEITMDGEAAINSETTIDDETALNAETTIDGGTVINDETVIIDETGTTSPLRTCRRHASVKRQYKPANHKSTENRLQDSSPFNYEYLCPQIRSVQRSVPRKAMRAR